MTKKKKGMIYKGYFRNYLGYLLMKATNLKFLMPSLCTLTRKVVLLHSNLATVKI